MKKINTIIRKEWTEVFRNRLVIFTVVFLPLMMTAIPLVMLYSMPREHGDVRGQLALSEIPRARWPPSVRAG